MPLIWTRERDGEHYGKPCYEYHATAEDRAYHIVWAIDAHFGISAYRRRPDGVNERLDYRSGIIWLRTLKACKARAERLETENAT